MAWVADDLARLERAIALGVTRVKYRDKEVQYRSQSEMLKLRASMKAEFDAAAGGSGSRVKFHNPVVRKGL